ncbi:putative methyltransferase-domain-containing protein [Glomus cerebriforme]|uniref:Putative methyltransferase-domain-containing protein n=1 Tax=Glomus cerebriforme TaxID=658196 RepID=A0A397STA2_9GLOM|nr:putative methyltransferase-domain-containing protein [Glomus cerebriforme]
MKIFHFLDDKNRDEEKSVIIKELLDPSYGCYVWPSAFVLAEYIWHERHLFKDKTILELGSGTSLPGFLCALLSDDTHVILTDRSDFPQILENIREAAKLNNLLTRNNIWIRGLMWGDFSDSEHYLQLEGGGGLFQLLNDIEQSDRRIDWILGSDTFYNPKDFEDIIVTVAFILTHHFPNAKFITSYQERSSKRSIQYLLDKWKLKCNQISLASFNFNHDKYINLNDKDDDDEDMESTGNDVAYATSLQSIFLLEIAKT